MEIVWKKLTELKKYDRNASIHDAKHVAEIMASIEEFGWTVPLLVDTSCEIVAGHGRYEAAKALGIELVPCVQRDDWSEAQVRTYRIADNEIAANRRRDMEVLRDEMLDISRLLEETGETLSLSVTALEPAFIESLRQAEDDLLVDAGDPGDWGDEGEVEPDASVLVKMQFPASVWLGSRAEVVALLDKMSKKYLCRVKINE